MLFFVLFFLSFCFVPSWYLAFHLCTGVGGGIGFPFSGWGSGRMDGGLRCFISVLFSSFSPFFRQGPRTDSNGWFWYSCYFFICLTSASSTSISSLFRYLGRHVSRLRSINRRRATCGFCLVMIRYGYGMVSWLMSKRAGRWLLYPLWLVGWL